MRLRIQKDEKKDKRKKLAGQSFRRLNGGASRGILVLVVMEVAYQRTVLSGDWPHVSWGGDGVRCDKMIVGQFSNKPALLSRATVEYEVSGWPSVASPSQLSII